MYRHRGGALEVLLAHPGGPLWAKKDAGAWSIPKGGFGEWEDALDAAKREFREEMGFPASGHFIPLTPVNQNEFKTIHAWAFEGDCDPSLIKSNTFIMAWPPKSGMYSEFPEIDRAAWFQIEKAKEKILKGQAPLLDELRSKIENGV